MKRGPPWISGLFKKVASKILTHSVPPRRRYSTHSQFSEVAMRMSPRTLGPLAALLVALVVGSVSVADTLPNGVRLPAPWPPRP